MSLKNELISILMPVRNAEPFLQDCLNSILIQSETKWELIAVEDHSTDDSLGTLRGFAKADERITVMVNEGTGIIDALRTAFQHSKGTFITRMDADDVMIDNKLSVLKQKLTAHGIGSLAVGQVQYFSDSGLQDGYRYYESWLNGLTESGSNYKDIYRECVIPSPCWMVHRSDLEKCGAFNSNLYPEDYDLCFRFYGGGLTPIPCSDVIHRWRDHPERSSRTDPNYADNRFLDLKLNWFLRLDHDSQKTLIVWGASSKGKALAKSLLAANVNFEWVCNNPNKIGKTVYGKRIGNAKDIGQFASKQAIIAVANRDDQAEIAGKLTPEEAFFFC